jgi:hypothetical protein
MNDVRLYPVKCRVDKDIEPIEIGDIVYNKYNSTRINYCRKMIRDVYITHTGHYWLHIRLDGLGDYIAPLTKQEADYVIKLNKT